jgi:hypothetical protein
MAFEDTSPVEEAGTDELNVETVDDQLDDVHFTGAAHDEAMDDGGGAVLADRRCR